MHKAGGGLGAFLHGEMLLAEMEKQEVAADDFHFIQTNLGNCSKAFYSIVTAKSVLLNP